LSGCIAERYPAEFMAWQIIAGIIERKVGGPFDVAVIDGP
jgi:hypothetical protein